MCSTVADFVYVDVLPNCDIHYCERNGTVVPASYDGKTKRGPWASMCESCMITHGVGLGTGKGQRYMIRPTESGTAEGESVIDHSVVDVFMEPDAVGQSVLFGEPDKAVRELFGEDLYRALKDIESRDPDGGEVEPTEAAHARHKSWAIEVYGAKVWDQYSQGGWEPGPAW
jgi:hypothetical protein